MKNPSVLKIGQASKALGVSIDTLRRWETSGKIQAQRTEGGTRVYSPFVKIGEAAKVLGVSIDTLRRWERSGKIAPVRTPGSTRLYSLEELKHLGGEEMGLHLRGETVKNPSTSELLEKRSQPPADRPQDNYQHFSHPVVLETLIQPKSFDFAQDNNLAEPSYKPKKIYAKIYAGVALCLILLFLIGPIGPIGLIRQIWLGQETPAKQAEQNVLAASSIAEIGKFLEINADTVITGNMAVNGESVFGEGITGKSTLSISGATTLSTTSVNSTLSVTGLSTLTGGLTTPGKVTLTNNAAETLLIKPASDPSSATKLFVIQNSAGTEKVSIDSSGATILSSTLKVSGATTLSSTISVSGATTLSSSLEVSGTSTLSGASTLAGATVISSAGAASTPGLKLTGVWYTSGSTTTSKPQLLVEPTDTTSTGWSASGTGIGVNAKSAFTGNLIDLQVAGISKFKVDYAGNYTAAGTITFPGLTASRAVFTDASSNLATSGTSAALSAALSDETGSGAAVFATSPTITTSLLTDSTTFALINTTATTINFGGAATTALNIGNGSGTITNIGNAGGATAINLTTGTGSQTFTSNVATGTTTTSGFVFDATAITSGTGLYLVSDSVTTGRMLDIATSGNTWTGNGTTNGLINLASTSTAGTGSSSSILLNLARSGANANTAHTAYGIYSAVTNTNVTSGTNVAGYFSASGATTANYGLIVNAGSVGIGTTTPVSPLEVYGSSGDTQLTITSATAASDPIIAFRTAATPATRMVMGIDQSDSNTFKMSAASTLGGGTATQELLRIDLAGAIQMYPVAGTAGRVDIGAGGTDTKLTVNPGAATSVFMTISGTRTGGTYTVGLTPTLSAANNGPLIDLNPTMNITGGGTYQTLRSTGSIGATTNLSSYADIEIDSHGTSSGYTLTTAKGIDVKSFTFGQTNNYGIAIGQPGLDNGIGATTDSIALDIPTATTNMSNQTATTTNAYGIRIGQQTYTSTTNTRTITNPASLYITGAPVASTNVTFGNTPYALFVDAGSSRFDTAQTVASATSATLDAFTIPADTITISGTTNITTATGFNLVNIGQPTYSNASIAVSNAATLYIANAPTASGGGSITNPYALWVDAGNVRFDGVLQMPLGSVSAPPYTFQGDTNTGIYSSTADTLDIAAGGSRVMSFTNSGCCPITAYYDISMGTKSIGSTSLHGKIDFGDNGTAYSARITNQDNTATTNVLRLIPQGTVSGGGVSTFTAETKWLDIASQTINFAGNVTNQRQVYIQPATYVGSGAARTLTNVYGLYVDPSTTSTNMTITNLYGAGFGANATTAGGTSSTYAAINIPAHTITDSTTTQITSSPFAAGVSIGQITVAQSGGAVTVDNAASLYIANAPTNGASVTLTNPYALWVDAGTSRFDGELQNGDGTTTTTKTAGFFDINSTAGLPTGVPSPIPTGTVPLTFDTTNNKLCRYSAGWQCLGGFADYSEWSPASGAESGDIVSITDEPNPVADETAPFMLGKSTGSYDSKIFGIVSQYGEDAQSANGYKKGADYHAVALAGRVPVKVSTENGPIEKGDYLTSSSTPGVSMKATNPGPTIGKALEVYSGEEIGKILVFVNVSFADPQQALSNLLLDEQGNLVIPKVKTASLQIGQIGPISQISPIEENALDVASKLKVIDEAIATQSAQLVQAAQELASASAELAKTKSAVDTLKLTPPETLLATGSATLANIKATETLSSEKLLTALDVNVSGVFKALGESFLGNTTIAGNLVVDGTFSISGNSINAIGSNLTNTTNLTNGTLYLQNNPLAQGLDILNGKFIFDKEGKLTVAGVVEAEQFSVTSGKSAGTGKILAGQTESIIENNFVKTDSIIILTPEVEISQTISVVQKTDGTSFKVKIAQPETNDITFSYLIIGQGQKVGSP